MGYFGPEASGFLSGFIFGESTHCCQFGVPFWSILGPFWDRLDAFWLQNGPKVDPSKIVFCLCLGAASDFFMSFALDFHRFG